MYTEMRKEVVKGRAAGLKITWPMLESAPRNNPLDDDESKQLQQTIEEKAEERARRRRPAQGGRERGVKFEGS